MMYECVLHTAAEHITPVAPYLNQRDALDDDEDEDDEDEDECCCRVCCTPDSARETRDIESIPRCIVLMARV